jgi:uncharacterized protein YndB with AHSA1/START domain
MDAVDREECRTDGCVKENIMAKADTTTGRRFIELELDLPGTPEQVWQAIATGPGITSWFVPTEVEEHKGGKIAFHLLPGMDSLGSVTAWEPTRRFAYEEPGWNGEAPPLATEFVIEARGGGTCRVRLVHSLFTSEGRWDDELDGMQSGWGPFFDVLRIYLRHFAGQRCTLLRPNGSHSGTHADAWRKMLDELGVSNPKVGETCRLAAKNGSPALAVTMRIDRPATGVAMLSSWSWGERTNVSIGLYFYGEDAARLAEREGSAWQAWMTQHFPQAKAESA